MRPKGWDNRYTKEEWHTDVEWTVKDAEIAYEAGADAMLEGLKKDKETFYVDRYNESKGWMVFIEEE